MKIIQQTSFQIEFTFEELCGIAKMIGITNSKERQEKFGLSEEEADALVEVYSELYDLLGEENC